MSQVLTVRVPDGLAEAIATEYAEYAEYDTRADYLRAILRHRAALLDGDSVGAGATPANTPPNTLRERVADLEARLAVVEDRLPADRPTSGCDDAPAAAQDGVSKRVRAAVDAVADGWDDVSERLVARRAAAEAVLAHAVETGEPVGKSAAVEQFRDAYPVENQDETTWWRKNARPVLSEYGEYSRGAGGYRVTVDDLPS